MILSEAVAEIERDVTISDLIGFPAAEPPQKRDWSRAPNGEIYVTITSSGVDGDAHPMVPFAREDDAVKAWLAWIRAYIPASPSILYWRERPALWNKGGVSRARFSVYSRLQCSPVKPDRSEEAQ